MIFTLPPKLIYAAGYMRIGNPIPYELRVKKGDFEEDFTPLIPYQAVKSHIDSLIKWEKFVVSPEEKGEEEKENIENLYSVIQKNDSSKIIKDEYYTPIKWLTTFTYDWKIKARVLKKSEIKRWRNPRGSGQLMNIELIDSDCTQILATFFNDAVDKFDHQILENNVYIFTNGTVKIANKKFTSIKNDFSLIFDRNARIDKAEDDSNIDTQGFHFFNIKQIEELKEITTIDFIGVVHYVGPITMINLKNGKQKERRNIIMTDDSGLTVNLWFWGDQAAISDYSDHPVLALKSVRVSDYSGRSLNSSEDWTILLNPEIERAHKLRKWYEKLENWDDLKWISFDASKICKDTTKNNERVSLKVIFYSFFRKFLNTSTSSLWEMKSVLCLLWLIDLFIILKTMKNLFIMLVLKKPVEERQYLLKLLTNGGEKSEIKSMISEYQHMSYRLNLEISVEISMSTFIET